MTIEITNPGDRRAAVARALMDYIGPAISLLFDTLAELSGSTGHVVGTGGQVIADGENNGYYQFGIDGWQRVSTSTIPAMEAAIRPNTQAEAEAGMLDEGRMTPLKVAQHIAARLSDEPTAIAAVSETALMVPRETRNLLDRWTGRHFESRAEALAEAVQSYVPRISVTHRRLQLTYVRDAAGTALTTADGATWSPADDRVTALHFGSEEDYDPAADSGTDDYAAITAAMTWVGSGHGSTFGGSEVWITWQSLVGSPIVPPKGVVLRAVYPASSYQQVGQTTYPITYREGSKLIGAHTSGPVVWVKNYASGARGLAIGSDETRRDAAISGGGAGLVNCGVLVETEDASGAILLKPQVTDCLIVDQPADGLYCCGDMANYVFERNAAINCGRHGHVLDDGQLSGRANKARPGLGRIVDPRGNNLGGHGLAIGHPDSGSLVPYRVTVENSEHFRCGNNPSLLYKDACDYIRGEQITLISCAASGSGGYSGNTPTLDYAYAVSGRQVKLINCRYISFATRPALIFAETGLLNTDIEFAGAHGATASSYNNFFDITAPVAGLRIPHLTGNTSGFPLITSELPSGIVADVEYSGTRRLYGTLLSAKGFASDKSINVADDAVGYFDFSADQTGFLALGAGAATSGPVIVYFSVASSGTSNLTIHSNPGSIATVGSGVPNGTTGTDGKLNLFYNNSSLRIYIENRLGSTRSYRPFPFAMDVDGGQLV